MKRLPVYFALLALLTSAFAGILVLLISQFLLGGITWLSYLIAIPISCLAFLLALLIGYFLAQPLRDLAQKVEAFRSGNTSVDFSPGGSLYEADCLSEDFGDLLKTSFSQATDLARRERRQSAFVSDVAHELRTPLTAMRGTAELLTDPDMPADMREHFGRTIVDECDRLTRLVNDLLSLQHIQQDDRMPELKRLNMKPIVQEAIDTLSPLLEQRRAIVSVEGNAADVLGDHDRLKQVMTNLIENASRFIEPGGHIDIEFHDIKGRSVVAVKDDGTGFGDTDPALLFERFFRTDASRARSTGGTGLGLAIVKSIVESHDGTVEAFNLPEGGACFVVAIPSVG